MQEHKPTVLIVDDEQINLSLLSNILKDSYRVKIAKNAKTALDIIANFYIDLILLDVVMPDMDGYEMCKILKKSEKTEHIPVIFVTGNTSTESEKKGFSLGAVDYITKPFNPITVKSRARAHMNLHLKQIELEMVSQELQKKNEELQKYIDIVEKISITDGLTDVFNRRHFSKIFPKILSASQRENRAVCFLHIDIDYFKQYNDNYGHKAGDDALIQFASTLKEVFQRGDDIVFRLGGEEFGAICHPQNREDAIAAGERVQKSIEKMGIIHEYSDVSNLLTASIGLVCKSAHDITSVDAIYKEADDLLYQSKNSGRNRVSSTILI